MMIDILGCTCITKHRTCFMPLRYMVGVMAWSAIIVAYGQRITLNFTISEIVPRSSQPYIPCRDVRNVTDVGIIEGELKQWNRHQIAWVLGFFYVGYIMGHIPAGLYVDRHGSRLIFSIGLLISSVMCIVQPSIISHMPESCLMVSRFIMGIGQSVVFPSISVLFTKWVPVQERSMMGGLSFSATSLGLVIGNLISGQGIKFLRSWAFPFYFWGIIGAFWYVIFIHYVFSDPASNPFITEIEKNYLQTTTNVQTKNLKIPWRAMMSDPTLWGLIFAQMGHDYSMYTQLSSLPRYLAIVPHFDVNVCSLLTSLPYIFQWVTGMGSGKVVNYLINEKGYDVARCRKVASTMAILFPPLLMFFVPYKACCDEVPIVVILCLYCLMKGPIAVGVQVNHLDMTRNFPGVVVAVVTAFGAITGLTPIFISWMVIDNTFQEWIQLYGFVLGIAIIGNVVYLFSCTAVRREWDLAPEEAAAKRKEVAHRSSMSLSHI